MPAQPDWRNILKIGIFGGGAVGGHLAARLAASGNDVSVVARGANLAALRERGVTLVSGEERINARVRASENPAELGPQDVVLVTLKATSLGAFAQGAAPLLGPDTMVVFAQNGIPWWYAQGLAKSRPRPPDLSRLDPGGALARAIDPARVIGAVIFSANTVVEPAVVSNATVGSNRLLLGETDDRPSPRLDALREVIIKSGMGSPPVTDIRREAWHKLLFNFGSVLTAIAEQTAADIMNDPATAGVALRLVAEGVAIGRAHGIPLEMITPSGAAHRPSILQDYEMRRPMEVEPLLLAPQAFARSAGLDTPVLDAVAALVALRASARGLFSRG